MNRLRFLIVSPVVLSGSLVQAGIGQSMPAGILRHSGKDIDLRLEYREAFRLGDAGGPIAFGQLVPWGIAGDERGRLYVLDSGDRQVLVFDYTGRPMGSVGRGGGGPGEFQRPTALGIGTSQELLVADAGKRVIVRFDSAGMVLTPLSLKRGPAGVGMVGPATVVIEGMSPITPDRVTLVTPSSTSTLAQLPSKVIKFSTCPIGISARPIYAPTLRWSAAHGRFAVSLDDKYGVEVWRSLDERLRLERAISPINVTRDDALQSPEARNGFTFRWQGKTCQVKPSEVVDARGFSTRRSPVERIAIAPDGSIWVHRRTSLHAELRTDLFNASGAYLGTLAPGMPFPIAFLSASRFVTLEESPDGEPMVLAYDFKVTSRKGRVTQ